MSLQYIYIDDSTVINGVKMHSNIRNHFSHNVSQFVSKGNI